MHWGPGCSLPRSSNRATRLIGYLIGTASTATANRENYTFNKALETIDFSRGPVNPVVPAARGAGGDQRLVECDKFVLDRLAIKNVRTISEDDRFHFLAVVEGSVEVSFNDDRNALKRGGTILIPASARGAKIESADGATVLDMYLP